VFFGKNICKAEDRILMTTDLKFETIYEDILRAYEDKAAVLSIFYFEETVERFKKILDEKNIRYQIIESSRDVIDCNFSDPEKVNILSFDAFIGLKAYKQIQEKINSLSDGVRIFLLEHYPLPGKDKEALELVKIFSISDCKVNFYVSLEDPLMRVFGSDKIKVLLEKLGCSDAPIEHPMIRAAISQAQGKIKEKATGDGKTVSSEAWFRYFCPVLYEKL
jgi:hypothetical protein